MPENAKSGVFFETFAFEVYIPGSLGLINQGPDFMSSCAYCILVNPEATIVQEWFQCDSTSDWYLNLTIHVSSAI